MNCMDLLIRHRGQLGLGRKAVLDTALRLILSSVQAATVVADLDDDVAALVIGVEGDRALFGLARLDAVGRFSMP